MSPVGAKQSKIFIAYEAKEYEKVVSIASQMTAQEFLSECREHDLTLIHRIALDDNIEAMMALS